MIEKINIVGQKFNMLTVIARSNRIAKNRSYYWTCKCDCGNTTEVIKQCLTRGNVKSCGCLKKSITFISYGDISVTYFYRLKHGAKSRGFTFDLSIEYLWNLFLKQNKKCALSGIDLIMCSTYNKDIGYQTASLDRIDNNLGYSEKNVRWIHKDLNQMRMDLSDIKFLDWCKKCYLYSENNILDNKNNDKWGKRFLELAEFISKWSLDPSTKVGAVITDNDHRIISVGYNGFPKGILDDERLNDRETKYKMVVHGEMNAILFANRPLKDCILYTWPFMCCSNCAVTVIQTGIKKVIAPYSDNPRWIDSFKLTRELFKEAGVELNEIDQI